MAMPGSSAKVIVITGVSRGLGEAMVAEFTCAGHTVAGCARSPKAIESLANIYKPPNAFEEVDVADDGAVAAWAKNVVENLGPPDLLINNAAIINRNAPLWRVSADEFS